VIPEFEVNEDRISDALARNPILATALVPRLGYDAVAKITNEARQSGRPIAEVAAEQSSLSPEEIDELLNPLQMAHPHSATRHE
jgi:fumarate hydratase class II